MNALLTVVASSPRRLVACSLGDDSKQVASDLETVEVGGAAHSVNTGVNYCESWNLSNKTTGTVGNSEMIDLNKLFHSLWTDMGIGNNFHGIFPVSERSERATPQLS